ncbi:DNA-directed RNA polymerase subunit omega [bacterium]|nr:DNA-directed RNA polymerase subunit omega [bacterium]
MKIPEYSLDEVIAKVGNKYKLTMVLAKRADQVLDDVTLKEHITYENVFDYVIYEVMNDELIITEYVEEEGDEQ